MNLLDLASVREVIAEVKDFGVHPVLIVFDTYARCMSGGDENSAKDAGEAISAMDDLRFTLETAVLVIHHTNKAGSGERGSGALRGAADTMLELVEGEEPRLLSLRIDDQKNSEAGDDIPIRLQPVCDSLVPVDAQREINAALWALKGEVGPKSIPDASEGVRGDILAGLEKAETEGRLPINQTALLGPLKGNSKLKGDVLHELVGEDNSPVTMKQVGNKKLYSLRR